jgi:hypothetical protein
MRINGTPKAVTVERADKTKVYGDVNPTLYCNRGAVGTDVINHTPHNGCDWL